jgi:hypothetical protein
VWPEYGRVVFRFRRVDTEEATTGCGVRRVDAEEATTGCGVRRVDTEESTIGCGVRWVDSEEDTTRLVSYYMVHGGGGCQQPTQNTICCSFKSCRSWWWAHTPETCTAITPSTIKFYIVASSWFFHSHIIRMHGYTTLNNFYIKFYDHLR